MSKRVIRAKRIGRQGRIAVGCGATVVDPGSGKILMGRREDNAKWSVIGGYMEPGESVTEACVREVREETGIDVRVVRLVGVYSNPDIVVEYEGDDKVQVVMLHFLAKAVGGELRTSDENTDVGWFSRQELGAMDLQDITRKRIEDSFAKETVAVLRQEFGL